MQSLLFFFTPQKYEIYLTKQTFWQSFYNQSKNEWRYHKKASNRPTLNKKNATNRF